MLHSSLKTPRTLDGGLPLGKEHPYSKLRSMWWAFPFLQLYVLHRMRSLQYYLLYHDTKGTAPQVNIFMGIGLLSMPFAMRQSGWMGMFALAIATAVFCVSGKLIVCNFEKMPPDVAHTYPALGAPPNSECISSSYAKQKGVCASGPAYGPLRYHVIAHVFSPMLTQFVQETPCAACLCGLPYNGSHCCIEGRTADHLSSSLCRQAALSAPYAFCAGRYALGKTGFWSILALAFTEFFGDSLIVLIVMWQEIAALLHPVQGEARAACPM